MDTSSDPSNVVEPVTSPDSEIVLAVASLVAVPALPDIVVGSAAFVTVTA